MKPSFFVLLVILSLARSVQSQDKLVLLNGDTLTVKVKKLSGSVITVDNDGLEQDINLQFVSKGVLATGKEIPMKGYYFKEYAAIDEGHTEMPAYSLELEQEADNIFSSARKLVFLRPMEKRNVADMSYERKVEYFLYGMNAFLAFDDVKGDRLIIYTNPVTGFKKYGQYKLRPVLVINPALGQIKPSLEKLWTAIITDKEFKLDHRETSNPYIIDKGKWILTDPLLKEPMIYEITYVSDDVVRYCEYSRKGLIIKEIVRTPQTEASIK